MSGNAQPGSCDLSVKDEAREGSANCFSDLDGSYPSNVRLFMANRVLQGVCDGLTVGQCYALNSKALQITTTQIVA